MATLVRDNARTTATLWHAIRNGEAGVTADSLGFELPHYGYYVGGQSPTLVMPTGTVTPDDVAGFVSTHPETRYFGMWEDDGKIYVDAVDLIYSGQRAMELARERGELAVFDISDRKCLEV